MKIIGIYLKIRMNEVLDVVNNRITPGSYDMTFDSGVARFDFDTCRGEFDSDDHNVMHFLATDIDQEFTDDPDEVLDRASHVDSVNCMFFDTLDSEQCHPVEILDAYIICNDGRAYDRSLLEELVNGGMDKVSNSDDFSVIDIAKDKIMNVEMFWD